MKLFFSRLISLIFSPITLMSSLWLKLLVRIGIDNVSDIIFMRIGVLPVPDHYYQPLINPKKILSKSLRDDRSLPGIDLNLSEQLTILKSFSYNEELIKFPIHRTKKVEFYYNNKSYCSGDAEYLYSLIRFVKPKRIIEIGSGFSTLMARNAIEFNKIENPGYTCLHICIEPFEQKWLERLEIDLIRQRVESLDLSKFDQLSSNDILFIDSSHIIRPQGDVLFEYLELLPNLKPGVLIHIHDIFTPKDYLNEWIYGHKLWNEQYLLEAFLTFNPNFKILGALNFLSHHHTAAFSQKCPVFANQVGREPGAFWIARK
jgi:predicted O-methyltransferase YrrM